VAGTQSVAAFVRGLPLAYAYAAALPGAPVRLAITPNPLPTLGIVGEQAFVNAQTTDRYGNVLTQNSALVARDTTIAQVNGPWVTARHHGTTTLAAQVGTLRDSLLFNVLGFTSVTEGSSHVCGLSLAGGSYCWGENSQGAVGDGTTTYRADPVLIGQGLGFQTLSTYVHTCALTSAGQGFCWGGNQSGELGDGSPNYATDLMQTLPVAVAGGHVFSQIRAGRNHTCAVATNGDAYCWGSNEYGQLGRDTVTNTCSVGPSNRCSDWPILVAGALTFAQVSAGRFKHSCGVTTSGAAYCWGLNDWGQLGYDSTTAICGGTPCSLSFTPRLVIGGVAFKSVAAGAAYSCGVAVSGDGYCWGYGSPGSLGNGSTVSSPVPVKVAGGLTFADLQAGWVTACGLTTGGRLYCWGGNYPSTPTPVLSTGQFTAIAVASSEYWGLSSYIGCALTAADDLSCF